MNQRPATPFLSTNRLRKVMSYAGLITGITLVPLLPIGMHEGFEGMWFDGFLGAHAASLLLALLASLLFFLRCATHATLSPLLTVGAFVLFTFVVSLLAALPITSRDALIHHLAVPQWWLDAGRIVPIHWHEWSFYPMLINLGFLGLMKIGYVELTPYYHFCYLILSCGIIASFVLYKSQDYGTATIAFLVALTIPVCLQLAATPLVDLGLTYFSVLAITHLIYWAEGKRKLAHIVIAGMALGLALGCKYNGILTCALVFLLAPLFWSRSGLTFGQSLRALTIVGLFAFLVFVPWLYKNTIWANNPFFPLFSSLFSAAPSAGSGGPRGFSPLVQRALLYQEGWLDIVTIPLQMLFYGQEGNPQRFDGVLSPILLLLLVPLLRARKEPWALFLLLLTISYTILALLMSSARVRYLAPVYGPAIILAALGIHDLARLQSSRYAKELKLLALSVALLWGAWHSGNALRKADVIGYLFGDKNQSRYLAAHIAEYPIIEYVNAHVPDTSTVYLLNTGNRFYYFHKKVFSSGHFSSSQLLRWIRHAGNEDFLAMEFKNRGIDFLLTNTALTQESLRDMLSPEQRDLWNRFQSRYLKPLHAERGFSLWHISDPEPV